MPVWAQSAGRSPHEDATEAYVGRVAVPKTGQKPPLPRGDATEAPVGRGVVAEDDVMTQLFGRWSCEEAAAAG